ncbi:MAG TPA: thioredoxin [Candidatus Tumulicola sp.]|nr:thioredoxin [Candidatus Tumulicola sp.]
MSLHATTDESFARDVLASPMPVLVEFTADWCPPCRMIVPVLQKIADDEASRLRVVSIDVDANPVTTRAYGVMSMPTLALFVDGKPVVQFVGAKPRTTIMRLIESHLPVAAG